VSRCPAEPNHARGTDTLGEYAPNTTLFGAHLPDFGESGAGVADGLSLTMSIDPRGELLDAARECEADVFFDVYGNTREQWVDEYGPYEPASVFLALPEPGGDVVGVCRVILPGAAGLKSLDDVAREPWSINGYDSARAAGLDASATIDVATIAVRRRLRSAGRMVWLALGHGVTMLSRANSLPDMVMIMDGRARRMMTSVGCDTFALPGTQPGSYLGSASSIPVWANVPRMLDNQRRVNPEGYRLVGLGSGFDGMTIPAMPGFELPARVLDRDAVLIQRR
jgi:hypothetical protein